MENKRSERPGPQRLPETVRAAVERTVQQTIGSAQSTRERAQEAVDEVVRRAETGAGVVGRSVRGAFEEARPATHDDLRQLSEQLTAVTQRLDELEKRLPEDRTQKRSRSGSRAKKRPAAAEKRA